MAATVGLATIYLTMIFSFLFTTVQLLISECSPGKYGVGCRYDCHCGSNVTCDPTSGCSDARCASGWSGPTCQRENVALNRSAVQSSTATYNGISHPAENAVDGTVGHSFDTTTCTHTVDKGGSAYWSVTLTQAYEIMGFTIYNVDCGGKCRYRLNSFTLSVGNTSTQNYTTCYQDRTRSSSGPGLVIKRNCQNDSAVLGNSVKISLYTGAALTLCEVQVFACSSGTWGSDCGQYCYCWNDVPCTFKSGDCPVNDGGPVCKPGYNGAQCNTVCQGGHYGPDCVEVCGNCAQSSTSCDRTNGECPLTPDGTRCFAGYADRTCKAACNDASWGLNCTQRCGQCWNNTACDNVKGICPVSEGNPRCNPGYRGENCIQNSTQTDYIPTIVGSVVGVIVAAFVLALMIFILRRHRKRPENKSQTEKGHSRNAREASVQYSTSHEEDSDLQMETHHYETIPDENAYENVFERKPSQESSYTHLS